MPVGNLTSDSIIKPDFPQRGNFVHRYVSESILAKFLVRLCKIRHLSTSG